ncbi:uncharacterized protein [Amphiura filiformis]|uniref:uncharacterized protein n=1 Tax=Amphiura filiformis TaxID=82378 RepID=UPI003B210009
MMTIRGISITWLLMVLVAALLPSAYTRGICNDPRQCGAAFGKRTGDIQIPQSFEDIQIPLQPNRDFELQSGSDADNLSFIQSLFKLLPKERQQRIQQDLRKTLADELFSSRRR